MDVNTKLSQRAARLQPAAIRKVVSRTGPDFISFVAGKPAPEKFPLELIFEKTGSILEKYGPEVMQYSSTLGIQNLRRWVAAQVPGAAVENVQIVAGSQQAIDLTGSVLLDPGDRVVVPAPTYTTALSSFRSYGVEFISVPKDELGVLPDALERAFQAAPKLFYCIPNFSNPDGSTTSMARRRQIVALAERYDVLILEDDPYGDLRFEGDPLPNLLELAPDRVIYAGTFSKTIAPGFRVGWLVAPDSLFDHVMMAKQNADLQVSSYSQILLHELVHDGLMETRLPDLIDFYRNQRDTMVEAMQAYFPESVKYKIPLGGMFMWCELPEHLDATQILERCLEEKVAYVPGEAFYADGSGKNTLRLSFSFNAPDQIEQGIRLLGKVFSQACAS
jgi:2-aminoadipate transaminase